MTLKFDMNLVNTNTRPQRGARWAALLLMAALGVGCASGPGAHPQDPLEPFNRGVFKFNDAVDRAVLKPVANTYVDVAPALVRKGVSNFFENIEDAWSFVNNTLQLKGEAASDSFFRFGVNTFLGLGGVLDVASEMRIEKHPKDFGHTLGYWGVGSGPYLILPLMGPSTVRDGLARIVDSRGDVVTNLPHVPTRNVATAVRLVDKRAGLLKVTKMLDEIALDRYTFSRDSYLQSRQSAIFDGNPPEELDVTKPYDPTEEVKP
jgi:phospholipid-binding lipoprotein MlaA